MSEVATPTVQEGGIPPVVPVAPPTIPATETVSLSKEEHAQLLKDAARSSEAQGRADRFENILKKNGLLGGGHFKSVTPATPPTPEERQAAAAGEDLKAERGLLALALDPVYREVLDKDPTLRDLLTKNPLAILPMFAPDALDADDAVSLVKEALNRRKSVPPPTPLTPPTLPTPPVGAINANDKPVNEAVEVARKIPNTERAVAGMIGARLKENAGKK